MNKYTVKEAFELDGVTQEVDAVVELDEAVAAPFVEEGKLELVADEEAEEGAEGAA